MMMMKKEDIQFQVLNLNLKITKVWKVINLKIKIKIWNKILIYTNKINFTNLTKIKNNNNMIIKIKE